MKYNMSIEKLEKDKQSSWGGSREGSGRKPLLNKEELEKVRELIGQHGSEIDGIFAKKERCLALLDVLYEEGFTKHNIAAIKEYFDRQLGKAPQGIDLTTKGEKVNMVFYLPEKK